MIVNGIALKQKADMEGGKDEDEEGWREWKCRRIDENSTRIRRGLRDAGNRKSYRSSKGIEKNCRRHRRCQ